VCGCSEFSRCRRQILQTQVVLYRVDLAVGAAVECFDGSELPRLLLADPLPTTLTCKNLPSSDASRLGPFHGGKDGPRARHCKHLRACMVLRMHLTPYFNVLSQRQVLIGGDYPNVWVLPGRTCHCHKPTTRASTKDEKVRRTSRQ
jgi:hypothetical protein